MRKMKLHIRIGRQECQSLFVSVLLLWLALCHGKPHGAFDRSFSSESLDRRLEATEPSASEDDVPRISDMGVGQVFGLILSTIGLAIAASGGIGGGTILVPVLVLIFHFPAKYGASISNTCIFGGAIANLAFNIRRLHPDTERPLIDFDISMMMIPMTMLGAVIGTTLAKTLPDYILQILLVFLLWVAAMRTLKKAIALYKKETARRRPSGPSNEQGQMVETARRLRSPGISPAYQELDEEVDENGVDKRSPEPEPEVKEKGLKKDSSKSKGQLLGSDKRTSPSKEVPVDAASHSSTSSPPRLLSSDEVTFGPPVSATLQAIIEKERVVPVQKIFFIFCCFCGILVITILGSIVVPTYSVEYWVLTASEIPWVAAFVTTAGWWLRREYTLKEQLGYRFLKGDVHWTKRRVITFPLICSLAGVVAGLFGIGGGVIVGPLMIEMDVRPEVAAATSAFMIFYTSATATVKYVAFGLAPLDWSLLFFFLGLAITLIAQIFVTRLVRRSGRESIICFLIATGILFGAIMMTYSAVVKTIDAHS